MCFLSDYKINNEIMKRGYTIDYLYLKLLLLLKITLKIPFNKNHLEMRPIFRGFF